MYRQLPFDLTDRDLRDEPYTSAADALADIETVDGEALSVIEDMINGAWDLAERMPPRNVDRGALGVRCSKAMQELRSLRFRVQRLREELQRQAANAAAGKEAA